MSAPAILRKSRIDKRSIGIHDQPKPEPYVVVRSVSANTSAFMHLTDLKTAGSFGISSANLKRNDLQKSVVQFLPEVSWQYISGSLRILATVA